MNRLVRRRLFASLLLLSTGLLLVACSKHAESDSVVASSAPSVLATGEAFPDLNGKLQPLAQWKGRVVLLNFWAPWCPPCRKEIPDLVKLQAKYANRGFTVVGIAIDTADNTQAFTDQQFDLNYPILVGGEKGIELAKRLGNTVGVLPYSVILDRRGEVLYTHRSEIDPAQVEQILRPIM